jgi:hypothetical protein
MSRWITTFNSHAFRPQLARLLKEADSIKLDDPAVVAQADEIARLRKVASYLDQAISGIDPELVPLSFWDQIQGSISACADQIAGFNASKNASHLHNANAQLDALLGMVRPHLLAKGRLGPALQSAAKAYSSAIEVATANLRDITASAVQTIKDRESTSKALLDSIETNIDAINEKHDELLVDSEEAEATFTTLDRHIAEINAFHRRLTTGTEEAPSVREEIAGAREVSKTAADAIEKLRQDMVSVVKELTPFESRILGSLASDGKREGGLSAELEARMRTLTDVEREQKRRYAALNEQIESLLPGATSAGLASAYKELKDSFATPIKRANTLFYVSIGLIVALSLLLSVEEIGFWYLKFVPMTDWTSIGRSLAQKIPFYAPLVWLAYYASKRRSEFQRLEQEYAHKEALAKSYESYRKQISDLGLRSDELMRDLLEKSVNAIAFNASTSLDGKHGDKIPAHEVVERMLTLAKDMQKPK